MNRRIILIALAAMVMAGCNLPDNSQRQIFRYNESAGITTLDPAFAKDQSLIWGCTQLYNGLVRLDEQLQPQPCIASNWTISPDGKTYTFTLRRDVLFHKSPLFGTPDSTRHVVAQDFVYSFNRIVDPATASPGRWVFADVDSFTATDDTTLVIRLRQPFSPFLSVLGMMYCSVVPHEVVEHYGKSFARIWNNKQAVVNSVEEIKAALK